MSGGTGASSKKLVGFANFKRHNPMADRFEMTDFDHLELWCHDATSVARRFATAFGMQMVAATDVDSGNHKYSSYCIQCENVRFVFTAPYYTDAPDSTKTRTETFPHLDTACMETFIKRHGVAGRSIGIRVKDATEAYKQAVANGGTSCTEPTTITDDNGTMTYSEVFYYEDVVLRFIQGREEYKGAFMPGYVDSGRPSISYGLKRIDHIVSNVPCLADIAEHVEKVLGFHEFSEFTAEDVGTLDSGLNSMVMANNSETVLLPINEPTFGTRRKSQIQSYLEHHRGPGVQHIAISTPDIIGTLRQMHAQSNFGGVEFMGNPGAAYYEDHVPKKMDGMVSQETIDECRKYNILIDRDEEGGLLQIFTKPLFDRPTLFIEIIQRLGCPLPDGSQKPACGGFGKGNFGALFKSIEDYEKKRDGDE